MTRRQFTHLLDSDPDRARLGLETSHLRAVFGCPNQARAKPKQHRLSKIQVSFHGVKLETKKKKVRVRPMINSAGIRLLVYLR
jgi:hypothetical protein